MKTVCLLVASFSNVFGFMEVDGEFPPNYKWEGGYLTQPPIIQWKGVISPSLRLYSGRGLSHPDGDSIFLHALRRAFCNILVLEL